MKLAVPSHLGVKFDISIIPYSGIHFQPMTSLYKFLFALLLGATFSCAFLLAQDNVEAFATAADGTKIHYKTFGFGQPLLLINGGPGFPSTHFEPLAKDLAYICRRQVIVFDQRGTGQTIIPKPDTTNVNLDKLIEDIEDLRMHLNFESWAVLGHSFGGILAMYYATQHPDRISAMVLSASAGVDISFLDHYNANILSHLSPMARDSLAYWDRQASNGADRTVVSRNRFRLMASAYVYNPVNAPTLADMMTVPGRYHPEINGLMWRDLNRRKYDFAPSLTRFFAPTLILQGRQDPLGDETAMRIKKAVPYAELVWLNECGHYLWLDQREGYLYAIRAFLDRR